MDVLVKRISEAGRGKSIIAVGRGVSPKAVERNLLKRRLRVLLRPFEGNNRRFLVIAKKGALCLSFKELAGEIASQMKTLK